ncbi:aspartoacylase [Chamaesiphon sp. OTE_8_metabat_110]|uniref:aspartoacylase n=1 Tax=Chamaesiphon sp. OTE_8_metabat_110 TaxID=2964696 RepID=UPI00286B80C0|nr:aspartoacylase [Chamaesiphon sp. OTE_8_metabat_110]
MIAKPIEKIAIVGGTHGNELTGVYVVEKLARFPERLAQYSFEVVTLLANPQAVAANRRYVDRDLNRSFDNDDLANPVLTGYEDSRAKEIAQALKHVDLIIDLHSSTSQMGLTILPASTHPFNLRLSAYLSQIHPDVRICGLNNAENPMLRSLSPLGCTIEVGAVAQGILDADLFAKTELLIYAVLDYVAAMNAGTPLPAPDEVTVYKTLTSIDYPRDTAGKLQGMIHPHRQFQDYQPLHPGDPLFVTFMGETIPYAGTDTVYPIFINEAAYYEKGIAMTFTDKQQWQVETGVASLG